MDELLAKIEQVRHIMHKAGLTKGIGDPEVLKISQKLDVLIKEYYKIVS